MASTELLVTIVSARGVRNPKRSSWPSVRSVQPSALCTCQIIGKPNSKFQTLAVADDPNPTWEREDYVEDYSPGDPLHFEVRHQDEKGTCELLGEVTLNSAIFVDSGFEGELELDSGTYLTVKVRPETYQHKQERKSQMNGTATEDKEDGLLAPLIRKMALETGVDKNDGPKGRATAPGRLLGSKNGTWPDDLSPMPAKTNGTNGDYDHDALEPGDCCAARKAPAGCIVA